MSPASPSLKTLREQAAGCRACPLWKDATQTVFGEGPKHASLMLVGEQPGDKEDLAGKPFVGPPERCWIGRCRMPASTGKSLCHQCRETFCAARKNSAAPEAEYVGNQGMPALGTSANGLRSDPMVVAMGATAAQSVFGKITPIDRNRGRLIELGDGAPGAGNSAPALSGAAADAETSAREYRRFVADLRIAAEKLGKSARAA